MIASVDRWTCSLTPRELEIVQLVAAGKSTRLIANELRLSLRTIENHLHSACSKAGAATSADLALVLEAGGPSPQGAS